MTEEEKLRAAVADRYGVPPHALDHMTVSELAVCLACTSGGKMTAEQKLDMGRRVVRAMARLERVGATPNGLDAEGWVDMEGEARSGGLHAPWFRSGEDARDLPDVTRAGTRGVLRGVLVALGGEAPPAVSYSLEPAYLVSRLELAADRLAPPRVSDQLADALTSGASPDRPLLERVLAALREVGR